MSELIHQLGIDWRLLLSQAVNFLLVLVVLRAFVYGPVVKILNDRKRRVEEGLEKANEADRRLGEVSSLARERIKEAEQESLAILKETEKKAKNLEAHLLEEARKKEAEIFKNADLAAKAKKEEAMESASKETARLVKEAIIKTVELSPDAIDEALAAKAAREISTAIEKR